MTSYSNYQLDMRRSGKYTVETFPVVVQIGGHFPLFAPRARIFVDRSFYAFMSRTKLDFVKFSRFSENYRRRFAAYDTRIFLLQIIHMPVQHFSFLFHIISIRTIMKGIYWLRHFLLCRRVLHPMVCSSIERYICLKFFIPKPFQGFHCDVTRVTQVVQIKEHQNLSLDI